MNKRLKLFAAFVLMISACSTSGPSQDYPDESKHSYPMDAYHPAKVPQRPTWCQEHPTWGGCLP